MITPSATYSPGSWVAASSASAWLLVDLGLDDPRLTDCWTALAGDDADRVLDVLLSAGIGALPGFALVVRRDSGTRVVTRHPAVVSCRRIGQESTVVSGVEGRTWTDIDLSEAYDELALSIGDGGDQPLRLPLTQGITPAGVLTIRGEFATLRTTTLTEESGSTPTAVAAETDGTGPDSGGESARDSGPVAPGPPTQQPPSEPVVDESTVERADEASAGVNYYGRLLGATVDRDALLAELAGDSDDDPAAVAVPDGHPPATSGHTAIWQPDAPSATSADDDESPDVAEERVTVLEPEHHALARTATPPTDSGGVIDGVPWAAGSSREPATPRDEATPVIVASPWSGAPAPVTQPSLSTPALGQNEAPRAAPEPPAVPSETPEAAVHTVNRAELLKSLAAPATAGPTVMAVRCPRAHLTSAYSAQCRVCGDTIEDQLPTEVQRPALGRLVLSTGETVILDRDVILGRAPESTEDDPALRPNLVRLTDSGEVSRMHVRVSLDGWQPILRDLGSSNGTVLTLASSSPQQLRPQEDYVLEPGCEVSLADVVSFRFDVTE